MKLARVGGRVAVARLDGDAPLPAWATAALASAPLASVTRTADELSIVCADDAVPADARAARDFVALRIVGTIALGTVGVLSALTAPLAAAGVPVFALSTFDTDYMLVRAVDLPRARAALATVADVTGV